MRSSILLLTLGLSAALAAPLSGIPDSVDGEWVLVPDDNMQMHLMHISDVEYELSQDDRASFTVVFRLYTRENPTDGQIIIPGDVQSLAQSNFNPNNPTRIASHGWGGTASSSTIRTCREAYLYRGDFNVIGVDWSAGADSKNYLKARNNVNEAARQVASLIDFLADHGMKMKDVYLIGHSLGAHVVGMTGKKVTHGKVNTIFGLDPAGPLFFEDLPKERLSVGDAEYVQTIQTNIGVLGFDKPLGDAAFYPNWGGAQPGCGTDLVGTCAHYRSWAFFGETIKETPDEFIGVRCDDGYRSIKDKNCPYKGVTGVMGGQPSDHSIVGVFYLPTRKDSPYSMGRFF